MGKLVAWLIVIFVVLLALRVVSIRAARAGRGNAPGSGRSDESDAKRNELEPMVQCKRCGVYVPRAETIEIAGGRACVDAGCIKR